MACLHHGGGLVSDGLVPNSFAVFFQTKVKSLSRRAIFSPNVYNGKRKVNCHDKMCMYINDIIECVKTIKIKNCEGYDRILQRILVEGIDHLAVPLTHLFK